MTLYGKDSFPLNVNIYEVAIPFIIFLTLIKTKKIENCPAQFDCLGLKKVLPCI